MIKSASSITIKYCTNCNDPHIVLCDEVGEPFAEAILVGETGQRFVEEMKAALYQSAVRKGEIRET